MLREIPFALVPRLWVSFAFIQEERRRFFAYYFFFRLITKTFYDHQDTYVAENNQLGDFVAYFCAALLLNWSADLKALDFQGIIVFLQRLPTDNWTLVEVRNSQLTAVSCSRILTLPHPHT